jgi:hypothetical protein
MVSEDAQQRHLPIQYVSIALEKYYDPKCL